MKHFIHIGKCKNVPELTQSEIMLYKSTFGKIHLPTQKIEKICKKIYKHCGESDSF